MYCEKLVLDSTVVGSSNIMVMGVFIYFQVKMARECIFKTIFKEACPDKVECSANEDSRRVWSIITASKAYDDGLHIKLERDISANPNLKINFHKNCVSKYATKSNYRSYLKDKGNKDRPTKRLRTSVTFNFLTHCLYCGESCIVEKDKKNPTRWRPAYMCRSIHKQQKLQKKPKDYKEYIIDKCKERNDDWGSEVEMRIEGAICDLHAADARYHQECMQRFFAKREPPHSSTSTSKHTGSIDPGFDFIVQMLFENKYSMQWNSIALYEEYLNNGGHLLTRKYLVKRLESHFAGELCVLNCNGYASVLMFQNSKTPHQLLVKDEDDNDMLDNCVAIVAKQIKKEIDAIVLDKSKYTLDLERVDIDKSVSETHHNLLSQISPKLANLSLPSLTVGHIVTGTVKGQSTELQVCFGVLLRESKMSLGYMSDYGVSCPYDEVLLFKKSAAVAAVDDFSVHGVKDSTKGLTQVIVDNFDADIHSANGKLSTHSLGMIVIQPGNSINGMKDEHTIKRLKYSQRATKVAGEPLCYLPGGFQQKPDMPALSSDTDSDLNQSLNAQEISVNRAKDLDFQFLKDVVADAPCPEHNGYNSQISRKQGHSVSKRSNIVYLPLIDNPPADPRTIMTSMLKAKKVSEDAGQEYAVFTADQQLYKVAVNILWQYPDMFRNFYIRLGGMHLLMNFVGSVGTLMSNSGLEDILSSTFGGVQKMLNGKKFPGNLRALRILTEELLRPVIYEKEPEDMEALLMVLNEAACKSRTAKLWVECLIQPVLIMLRYIRAEREGDWLLHLNCVEAMVPYFFAAGHQNYARYGLYYLRSMESMPDSVKKHFLQGEHVVHLSEGIYNGIWSDMAIESTLMRYGHGPGGIIGVTLKPETVRTWAYSMHACNRIERSLDEMRQRETPSKLQHKEEMPARIKSDAADRMSIQRKLTQCIDPIQEDQYPNKLVNIVTGQVLSDVIINVDKAVDIGKQQMEKFEKSWPKGFHDSLHKSVKTMASAKKHIKVGTAKVYDTETIYARAMALQHTSQSYDTEKLLSCELSPYPTAMFDGNGLREAKSKAVLMNELKVEVSGRQLESDGIFIDGCAFLYVIPWPKKGTVQDFLNAFRHSLEKHLCDGEVFLIFDR